MITYVEFMSGRIVRFDDFLYAEPESWSFPQADGRRYSGPYVEYKLRGVPTETYRSRLESSAARDRFFANYRAWLSSPK